MTTAEKCSHGVYLAGEEKARYCQSCTPGVHDRTLRGMPKFKSRKPEFNDNRESRVDVFMSMPFGARVTQMEMSEYE